MNKFKVVNENLPYIFHRESPTLKVTVDGTEDEKNLIGDIADFLNDKYCDKEINMEWPKIDREKRIKYHEEQLKLLKGEDNLKWNEHGDKVERSCWY
jgi:predicted metal-dependent phosphoesterase TrpH